MLDLHVFRQDFPQTSCSRVADELERTRSEVVTWRRMYLDIQEENFRLRRLLSPEVTRIEEAEFARRN